MISAESSIQIFEISSDSLLDLEPLPSLSSSSIKQDMASDPSSSSSSSSIHPTDSFISKLRTAASAEKALIRPTEFYIESNQVDSNSYNVTGWKTQEFAYRLNSKLDSRLPTLARGLFTTKVQHSDSVEANQDGAPSRSNQQNRIAVRGYDKFFNLDEMPWTSQASIERYSSPPYLLTFKENGCIIFISSLSPKRLLVTSKNSLGRRPEFRDPRQINKVSNGIQAVQEEEEKRSHSEVGEEWLEKHLKSVGRTKEELAEVLWKRDETAVFELCDDSFEEHVLSYPLQRSGLHLHGLNSNSSTFKTQHMEVVDSFAEEWGFIKTRWLQMDTMTELKKFTEEVGKTGRWEGEGIEGFVVRTTVKEEDEEQITDHQDQKSNNHGIIKSKKIEKPPYGRGMAFFYKIKFDEPYLMYREWREMTRKMLASHQSYQAELETCTAAAQKAVEGQIRGLEKKWMASNPNRSSDEKFELPKEGPGSYEAILKSKSKKPEIPKLPLIRSNRPETHVFVQWVQDILYGTQQSERKTHTEPKPTPEIFSKFHQTKGIIATRETFIKYLQTEEGQSRLRSFQVKSGTMNLSSIRKQDSRPFEKVLLAPIAVVGCGKTSVCRALEQLFGWKMEQSDDIKTKKTGPTFLRNVNESLSLPIDEEGNDNGEQLGRRSKKSIGKGKGKGVIADRNNLLFVHREELVNLVAKYESLFIKPKVNSLSSKKANSKASTLKDSEGLERKAPQRSTGLKVRMIALAYRIEPPLSEIRRICLSRIEKRGDNHQNVRISDGKEAVEVLLDKFLKDFQPFNDAWIEGSEDSCDNGFDDVIHLDVEDDLLTSVTKVVNELIKLGVIEENERPSEKDINDAVSYSESYQIGGEDRKINTAISKLQQREETARYYAIQLEMNLEQIMRELIKDVQEEPKKVELEKLVEVLNKENTWIKEPHVTLVHGESVAKEKKWNETEGKENLSLDSDAQGAIKRWDLISSKFNEDPKSQSSNQNSHSHSQALPITVSLDLVAWNSRAISLRVSSIHCQDSDYFSLEQMEINQDTILHVTVGTTAVEIRPYEGAKVLKEVEKVREGEEIGGNEVPRWLELKKELVVKGSLKGMK